MTAITGLSASFRLAVFLLVCSAWVGTVQAQADLASLRAGMENPGNPLLQIQSSQGDLYLELFPDAAPLNVQRVLQLVNAQFPLIDLSGEAELLHYYDGMTFHRVIPGTFIQTGAAERANRNRPSTNVNDEINGRVLGLEQQRLIDASGKPHPWMNIRDQADFQEKILIPLYRYMNINSREELENRQQAVHQRLLQMNLLQAHENMGYRYNASLPSRRPVMGSVIMVNNGPGGNDGEFVIALQDTPWLTATHTVVGRVIAGLPVAMQISRNPAATVRIYQIRQVGVDTQE